MTLTPTRLESKCFFLIFQDFGAAGPKGFQGGASFCGVEIFFGGIEVAYVSFLVSRSLFGHRDSDSEFCCSASRSSSSWDQPVHSFLLGLDIL